MGLMDKSRSPLADRRRLQRTLWLGATPAGCSCQCARQSLVLLKNERKTLPLSKKLARVHVGGKSADNIGNQRGGWTIDWQGKSGEVTPGGTTTLRAIQNAVSQSTKVTFSKDGSGAGGADVGIVVVGEGPYAEGMGDRDDLTLAAEDLDSY